MGENEELQTEELEVLKSIYEGDECYTNPSPSSHLYKFGEVGTLKTFILGRSHYCITYIILHFDFKRLTSLPEIKWVEEYPAEMPTFSLESFYNKHLVPEVKQEIIKAVTGE